MRVAKQNPLDPLYVIFEQHLYNYQEADLDRKTFVTNVVRDYLLFLRRKKISVPRSLEASIVEELSEQIQTMLLKKVYGFVNLQEYQKKVPTATKRRVKARYAKLSK